MESIYIHPDYNDMETLHDIAIAKLDRPFDMDSFSAAVCLPDVTEDEVTQVPKSGDTCLAVGWGLLEDDYQRDVADTLQEVKVPIKEECQKNNANASMYICGGFDEGGKDTCQGRLFKSFIFARAADFCFNKIGHKNFLPNNFLKQQLVLPHNLTQHMCAHFSNFDD